MLGSDGVVTGPLLPAGCQAVASTSPAVPLNAHKCLSHSFTKTALEPGEGAPSSTATRVHTQQNRSEPVSVWTEPCCGHGAALSFPGRWMSGGSVHSASLFLAHPLLPVSGSLPVQRSQSPSEGSARLPSCTVVTSPGCW